VATIAIPGDSRSTELSAPLRWACVLSHFAAFLSRPSVAYPLLALLQLKVLWGDWLYRDLENGDNLIYVQGALRWAELGAVELVWSPLYSVYYGAIILAVGEPASANWVQRALMTFATTLMVLAALRALLPSSIAWLLAAWWATLESVFNVTVEVHLFAILPLLLSIVLVTHLPGRWGRVLALGVLLTAAALVRNEYVVSAVLCGAFCVWVEVRQRRWLPGLAAYAGAVVVVGLIVVWFDARANEPIAQLIQPYSNLSWKHTANFCQAYAASYVQRHTDWSGDVFLGCNTLMERDFGLEAPTLRYSPTYTQALLANPGAIAEHMAWNLGLTGNGLQVALFGAMTGTVSPEFSFISVKQDRELVPILSAGLVALLLVGAVLCVKNRRRLISAPLDSLVGWAVLLSGASMTMLVIAAVRPRPEYIYPLVVLVLVLAGGSLALIGRFLPRWLTAGLGMVALVAALVVAPSFYADPVHVRPRSALARYETLRPYAEVIRDRQTVFLMGEHAAGLTTYLGRQLASMGTVYRYDEFLNGYTGQILLETLLADHKVTLFFLDQAVLTRLQQYDAARALLNDPESIGWRLVGQKTEGPDAWMLLRRTER
jgi:hypothetical protein